MAGVISGRSFSHIDNTLNLKAELTNAREQIRKFFYDALGQIYGYLAVENEICDTYNEQFLCCDAFYLNISTNG